MYSDASDIGDIDRVLQDEATADMDLVGPIAVVGERQRAGQGRV
jgi:hypothetical protein